MTRLAAERDRVQFDEYDYSSKSGVRKAIRALFQLQGRLQASGDQMAGAIMADIKTCLGGYNVDKAVNVLTARQRDLIIRCLVKGDTEQEAALELGIRQSSVNRAINGGITRMMKHLAGEPPVNQEWSGWEEQVLIELYYDKGQRGGAKGVASRLGRSVTQVHAKAKELRKKGRLVRPTAK